MRDSSKHLSDDNTSYHDPDQTMVLVPTSDDEEEQQSSSDEDKDFAEGYGRMSSNVMESFGVEGRVKSIELNDR